MEPRATGGRLRGRLPLGAVSPPPPSRDELPLIHSLAEAELADWCRRQDLPPYRAAQIWRWLYVQRAEQWSTMKNLPGALREALARSFRLDSASVVGTRGEPGATRKLLVELADGERVEEVLIPAVSRRPASGSSQPAPRERRTVCLSSQAGCRFRCAFCASGQAGFRRNLAPGEMVGQVLVAARNDGQRPTHVVFMGIGEPLDNIDAVLKAIHIINHRDGLAIGARRITISTCGIVPGIRRLRDEGVQVELSVSLHAPTDALRSALMPVNRKYPLDALLGACSEYSARTRRIITFEYTLIRDVNDSPAQAAQLARLLAGLACRVNLIPLSPVDEYGEEPSRPQTAQVFIDTLQRAGINATLRASKGSGLKAACGQLRYSRNTA